MDADLVGAFVKNRVALSANLNDLAYIYYLLDGFVAWRVVAKVNDNDPEFVQNPKLVNHTCESGLMRISEDDNWECTATIEKDWDTGGVTGGVSAV